MNIIQSRRQQQQIDQEAMLMQVYDDAGKAKRPRYSQPPLQKEALKCPRCDSTNTKFCYYNNYSFSQPRYLCKSCRRYWTHGGTLRDVPVGGACRKNKRNSIPNPNPNPNSNPNPSPMVANSTTAMPMSFINMLIMDGFLEDNMADGNQNVQHEGKMGTFRAWID